MTIVSKNLSAKQSRCVKDAEILAPTAQTTTDSYADVTGSKIDVANYTSLAIVTKNTHGSNSIDWKVLGSIDDSTYVEIQAEATLAAAAVGSYATTQVTYRYYKVQVKASSAGNQGTATVHVIAK